MSIKDRFIEMSFEMKETVCCAIKAKRCGKD